MLELVSPTTAPRSAEIGPDVPLKSRGATLRRESMKNWSALLVVGCTMEKWHLIDCPVQLPKDSLLVPIGASSVTRRSYLNHVTTMSTVSSFKSKGSSKRGID
jgi:hypothetical protein